MTDYFLILTPLLLLPVIALLGFAGCGFKPLPGAPAVSHEQTVVKSAPIGSKTVTADPLTLQGGELIIATVQWSAGVTASQVQLTGASFAAVAGAAFAWNRMNIQVFFAANPINNKQITVTATLTQPSSVPWNLCVSAYAGAASSGVYSPVHSDPAYTGNNPQAPAINIGQGDLVYAVAFAANSDGVFPGSNSLTAGAGFAAEFPQVTNPLVEDGAGNNPVTAQVTNSNPDPAAKGFILAMGVPVAKAS